MTEQQAHQRLGRILMDAKANGWTNAKATQMVRKLASEAVAAGLPDWTHMLKFRLVGKRSKVKE